MIGMNLSLVDVLIVVAKSIGITALVRVSIGITTLVGVSIGITTLAGVSIGITIGVATLVGITIGVASLVGVTVLTLGLQSRPDDCTQKASQVTSLSTLAVIQRSCYFDMIRFR